MVELSNLPFQGISKISFDLSNEERPVVRTNKRPQDRINKKQPSKGDHPPSSATELSGVVDLGVNHGYYSDNNNSPRALAYELTDRCALTWRQIELGRGYG